MRFVLGYMKKMREFGYCILYLVYNCFIICNLVLGRRKFIVKDFVLMKVDKVVFYVLMYYILMKFEVNEYNVDGVLKVFEGMKKVGVEVNEVLYCILVMVYVVVRLYMVVEVYMEEIERIIIGDNWLMLDVLMILYGCLGKEKEVERVWNVVKGFYYVRLKSYLLVMEVFG